MKTRIPLPEYKPDQSNNSGVLLVAKSVIPAIDGYRSVRDITTVSDAMTASFQGGASAIASDGEAYLIAGTATTLDRIAADGSWSSLTTGLTITGRWRFSQFKDYTIAVNNSTTRVVDLDLGTAAALAGAPTGTSVAVVGDHVVIGRANSNISRVQWSAFDDHTGWTAGVDQSGFQDMQTGGSVMGVAGGEYGIILQRERLVRMTLTGVADTPFAFDEISSNFGCSAAGTIAQAGRTVFFYSDRGFMALDDGQELRPIGREKVDRTFESLISRDSLEDIYAAVDPQNKLVMWLVPGNPGTVWLYNFELDRWSTIEIVAKGLFPGFTTSVKLDELDALGYTNLDAMTISLDDPIWSGGNPRLYFVTWANKIGNLTGDTLAARLDLGFNEYAQGQKARVRNIRPVWDGLAGMTVRMDAKQRLGDASAVTSTSTLNTSGILPIRISGKYISALVEIAAATDWDYIQAIETEFEPGAVR